MRRTLDEGAGESGELALVPYLDIITNVLLFLMMTVGFSVAATEIPVSSPGTCGDHCVEGPRFRLGLAVHVSAAGFTLSTSSGPIRTGGALPTVPARDDGADLVQLAQAARAAKTRFPDDNRVVVSADPRVPYERVVQAMDALRGPGGTLFGEVVLAAGVEQASTSTR